MFPLSQNEKIALSLTSWEKIPFQYIRKAWLIAAFCTLKLFSIELDKRRTQASEEKRLEDT
jgi:hypothetical protein